tara:strand:- start:13838 stop:14464 length:627 start_codon:yes stop_codon:yes gene_type:complete
MTDLDWDKKFARALEKYSNYLYAIIRNKFGGPQCDCDEIFQETQLRLWAKRYSFASDTKEICDADFKKWVAKFAHNQTTWYLSKKYRKDRRIDFDSEKFDVVAEVIGAPDENFEKLDTQDSLQPLYHKYAAVLTPHQRNVFQLLWRGLGIYQIGQILGVSHQRISQIKEDIILCLRKHFDATGEPRDNPAVKMPEHLSTIKSLLRLSS